MNKSDLRIVFMGTPDFAVESLRKLVENEYKVVGVVTTPDKPVGRHGSMLCASPVKEYALSKGLPVLQPEKLKDDTFLAELRSLQAGLQIVVAFRILPEAVWDMPRYGTFNLHGSLLPQYRGAAPINWAVIHGEKETGVTTFYLTHGIDTGRIIRQRRISVTETDHAGIVHDKLMVLGAELVLETVDLVIAHEGRVETISQENLYSDFPELRPAPKLYHDTCRINWRQPACVIYNFIRGLSPYPAAWTEIEMPDGTFQTLKIYETVIVP
ncbi:MAG: methionyl-tRNA formyltransferase, partial [Tannerella sp.]|nr:methionyl-tRNA formyltransferase [Tannerella sp.]